MEPRQFDKYKKKKEFINDKYNSHMIGPVGYDPSDAVPYASKEWRKTTKKVEEPKKYEWSPQLQALEDILWAS